MYLVKVSLFPEMTVLWFSLLVFLWDTGTCYQLGVFLKHPLGALKLLFSKAGFVKHFFVKSQIWRIFGFVGHTVFVTTAQLCCCSMKTTRDNTFMAECDSVPLKLYKNTQWARFGLCTIVCWPKGILCIRPDCGPSFFSSTWRIFRRHGKDASMPAGICSSSCSYLHSAPFTELLPHANVRVLDITGSSW